ncbi:hypothetical protein ACIA8O_13125 [Kitasatospora sp. NPDC051853]|uniref:hypothetical protein n=1 Tax=Kitasatospora sp. NPDC051853 TaxID=3364058 RepID=UPI0037A56654
MTVHQAVPTLRNALNAAVRPWRLRHSADHYADQPADSFEVMLGTGTRRGEVPALHGEDARRPGLGQRGDVEMRNPFHLIIRLTRHRVRARSGEVRVGDRLGTKIPRIGQG